MCVLCLQDFEFELPVEPKLDQKKKRLLTIKSLLQSASQMNLCEVQIEFLKEEQYQLSREF